MLTMKNGLILMLLALASGVTANNAITSGDSFELYSKVLKEKRTYFVYLPPSYATTKIKKYPVLYVLDGNETVFRGISGLVEMLSSVNLSRQIPEAIIVAIVNTNRNRDLTPTTTDLIYDGKLLAKLETTGGAKTFISFIENELMQKIDSTYRVSKKRALIGMSFGGLFSAYVLKTQPDLFTDYLIADATFIWDSNYLNQLSLDALKTTSGETIKVFIALANNDHIGEHGVKNREWGNQFIKKIRTVSASKLSVESKYFPQEQHGTVEMLAWYHGLISLFNKNTKQPQVTIKP